MARSLKGLAPTGGSLTNRHHVTGAVSASVSADSSRWLDTLLSQPLSLPLFGRGTLAPGWKLERRALPEHLVYFVAANSCAGQVGKQPVHLGPGTLLWVPPSVPFELSLSAPQRPISLLRFRLTAGPPQASPPGSRARRPIVLVRAWELRPFMEGVLDELTTNLPCREYRLRAWLVGLFSGIFRLQAQAISRRSTLSATQCQRLTDYVGSRPSARPQPAELAAHLRLSADYFSRRFQATFGMSPRVWLVRERIRAAAHRLLDSDRNASELAEELGYPDIFAFSRQFKKVLGLSPLAYRKVHGPARSVIGVVKRAA